MSYQVLARKWRPKNFQELIGQEHVVNVLEGPFARDKVHQRMDQLHELLTPYVVGAGGEKIPYSFLPNEQAFHNSLTTGRNALKPHVESRHEIARQALESDS